MDPVQGSATDIQYIVLCIIHVCARRCMYGAPKGYAHVYGARGRGLHWIMAQKGDWTCGMGMGMGYLQVRRIDCAPLVRNQ